MDRTIVKIPKKNNYELPKQFQKDDVRYAGSLVKYFLKRYTEIGDKVLDPFAGFGTTLFVAEEMQRIPFGIELQKDRYEFIKSKLNHKNNIIKENSLEIDKLNFPEIDFCITSPPYMTVDELENPLANYETKGSYDDYLEHLTKIFQKIKSFLKINGFIIIEVSNIKHKFMTTLAWDIGKKLSEILEFQGEIIIEWEGEQTDRGVYGYGYDHSYCLVFKNTS